MCAQSRGFALIGVCALRDVCTHSRLRTVKYKMKKINIWPIVYVAFKKRVSLDFDHRENLKGLIFGKWLTSIV